MPFMKSSRNWHIKLIRIAKKYYHPDMILWHDDMGSQKNAFFSPISTRKSCCPTTSGSPKPPMRKGHVHHPSLLRLRRRTDRKLYQSRFLTPWEGQDGINNKDAIMEQYGDRLAPIGQLYH